MTKTAAGLKNPAFEHDGPGEETAGFMGASASIIKLKGFSEKCEADTPLDFFPAVRKQVSLALGASNYLT